MITYKIPKFKIDIGDHPVYSKDQPDAIRSIACDYDVVINVSDDPGYGLNSTTAIPKMHWFPLHEFGNWTYQSFYWMTHLLNNYTNADSNIYLHCHMGRHRSPLMAYVYIRSLGHSADEAYGFFDHIIYSGKKPEVNWLEQTLQNDIEYGRIPEDVIEFVKDVINNPGLSMMHIMKLRKILDLPPKTIERKALKKAVGQEQIEKYGNDAFVKD